MMRSWLTRLWRLGSATVRHLQAGDRETHGGTPSESEGLTTREAYGVHPGPRAGEDGSPSSISEAESKRGKFPFLFLFVLFRPSVDCIMPTHTAEAQSISSVLLSSRNTVSDTTKNNL